MQKDISKLEAQLDQKRIDHMIKVRKIDPDEGRGFAATGPMMGYGGQYPESCWQQSDLNLLQYSLLFPNGVVR